MSGQGSLMNLLPHCSKLSNFRLIEREQIQKILQEQDFGAAGRIDPVPLPRSVRSWESISWSWAE